MRSEGDGSNVQKIKDMFGAKFSCPVRMRRQLHLLLTVNLFKVRRKFNRKTVNPVHYATMNITDILIAPYLLDFVGRSRNQSVPIF